MFKLLRGIFLCFVLSQAAVAQGNQDIIVKGESDDCEIVAKHTTSWIMYFYSIKEYDSASMVLDNWEALCGTSEPIIRTRILFAIRNNTFSEDLYDSTIVDDMLNYMIRMDTSRPSGMYNNYKAYFGYVPLRGDYDKFTQSVASELLERIFYDPAELLFAELYANVLPDAAKTLQKDTTYLNTSLRGYYYKRVDKYLKQPEVHIGFYTGMWIPFENAAWLGNHPLIGFQIGLRSRKMIYNLSLDLKFLKSKNEYTILRDGYTETTSTYAGIYFGADIEREVFNFGKNTINLLGGIGYDGFDSVKVNTEDDNPDNDKSHMISSMNTNFGLGYRHIFKNKNYIGLQGKYHFVNYDNAGGTNFAGNCVTISVSLGGFVNEKKSYNLNELRYGE